ncbi:thrombospondin type-1 domain-containing protein 4 [Mobula hypostoma]|uniref:thrombospondin type-1 domain-containing protein 4 n=1 Tax=Mobula hypostoma TaxID=723540 RepID=UPI002FC3B617
MKDGQRWTCRFCWVSAIVGFQLLTTLQCSWGHRKVPQRKPRQAAGGQEPGDGAPGVWSSWGPWSACSANCGPGVAKQSRSCLPREPVVPGWALRESSAASPRQWLPYASRSVSALMPSYPLHVDSQPPAFARGRPPASSAQQVPARGRLSNHISLPLYGDGLASGWPESQASQGPANEGQSYGQLTNRGYVPLYRQGQASNQQRQRLPASRNLNPSYGAVALTNRETRPRHAPGALSNQGVGSGSQPRQRSAPFWRGSTENSGHSWVRQEHRPANRSRSRAEIRPGLYGYGKIPADFQLRSPLQPSAHQRSRPRGSGAPPPAESPLGQQRRQRRGLPSADRRRDDGLALWGPPETPSHHKPREYRGPPRRQKAQLSRGREEAAGREGRDPSSRSRSRRPRRQDHRAAAQASGQEWGPYPAPLARCPGASTQYKICSPTACPSGISDPRREQCASFNAQPFMGRYYEWEPFTEVRKEQRCELNCRPVGYRFYVRHADRVSDGTPCEANSSLVCVAGQCLTAGCDGLLGSETKPDKCGVCGGDESTCRVVFGTFEDPKVPVGYHKILEIPRGAKKINVTEMGRSHNYLALRSQSGESIINGNWAIDRPGTYEAAGTTFTYVRPVETNGESFYAEGPTSEGLDVYMIFQQDNPGIHYQFILPVENPLPSVQNPLPSVQNPLPPHRGYGSRTPVDRREVSALGSGPTLSHQPSVHSPRVRGAQRDRRLQVYHPPAQEDPTRVQSGYHWKSLSSTECSVTCGKGVRLPVYSCVSISTQEVVDDTLCDRATKPDRVEQLCNTQPCPAFWSVGGWSECSRTCGAGTQHRQVLCRQSYANRTVAVHPHRCRDLDKPNATQPCQNRACTHWQIQTDWESCSVPCGVGQRRRRIRCVSNQGDVVGEDECSGKQKPTESEACDMGPCVSAWFHTNWGSQCSVACGVGVQKRTVLCLADGVKEQKPGNCEGPRPADTRACTRENCHSQVRWFTSPWGQCAVECGNGTQSRDLICVTKSGSDFMVMQPSDCAHLNKPATVQACSSGPCGARWFTTGWGECSKSCQGGVQTREVRCLDDASYPSSQCPEQERPLEQRVCHTHPCLPELDASCKDTYYNCALVVQARLCVYSYYKMMCCASCTHAERRMNGQRPRAAGRRAGA